MTHSASHHILCFKALIFVELCGEWSTNNDLAYLSELSESIGKMRGQNWTMVVDMRKWQVPESIRQSKYKIQLDRRNQKAECWIVNQLDDNEYLVPFFKDSPVQPQRFLSVQSAIQALQTLEIDLPTELLLKE
jgi:hypothetical protein